MKQIAFSLSVILLIASCKPADNSYKQFLSDPALYAEVVHELNTVVMGNNFPPIVASRNYTYAAVAAYEAMAAGNKDEYFSLSGQLNALTEKPVVLDSMRTNFHLAALLAYMNVGEAVTFPEGSMTLYRDSIVSLAQEKGLPDDELEITKAFADSVTAIVLRWSKTDNYAATRGSEKFHVMDSPGRWIPTPPMYADAVEPNWTRIRPLVMDSATQFVPPPPPPYNMKDTNSAFYKEVMAVKRAGETLTEEQKHIANFWDDNPFKLNVTGHVMFSTKKFSPPGHWMGIVGIAAQKAKSDFEETVYAYAITAIAGYDAFIQCWDAKYRFAYVRPETVINTDLDANWRPLLQTPAFPEYTCGHSTTSAASAEALTKVFGDNFKYTDTTESEFGIEPRSFTSFRQAAEENNWARFYGGIHFHNSCIVSTDYGKRVGELVVNRLNMKKTKS